MESLLGTVAAAVAVIASAAGVLVAFDQLTLRSRMRRIGEWTKDLAEDETDSGRTEVLANLRVWATAQVVSSVLVPSRFYVEAILWTAAVPFIIIRADTGTALASTATTGLVVLTLNLRRAIRIHSERYRVAREYFQGGPVAPPRLTILHQMEGGSATEFGLAALLSSGVVGLSLGAAFILQDPSNGWGLAPLLLGGSLGTSGLTAIRRRTPSLLHPG